MTVDFRDLLVGQTFSTTEPGTVWCDHTWTVVESRAVKEEGVWRIVAERPWEFGTHTVTQDYPTDF